MISNVNVRIPDNAWEDASESGQPDEALLKGTRLHTSIHVNGVLFHCEAIEVKTDFGDVQTAVNPAWESTLNEYCIACASDGPMSTVKIDGREYVICITPSCD